MISIRLSLWRDYNHCKPPLNLLGGEYQVTLWIIYKRQISISCKFPKNWWFPFLQLPFLTWLLTDCLGIVLEVNIKINWTTNRVIVLEVRVQKCISWISGINGSLTCNLTKFMIMFDCCAHAKTIKTLLTPNFFKRLVCASWNDFYQTQVPQSELKWLMFHKSQVLNVLSQGLNSKPFFLSTNFMISLMPFFGHYRFKCKHHNDFF